MEEYDKLDNDIFIKIGPVIMIIGALVGVVISLYAIIKYNKGIF